MSGAATLSRSQPRRCAPAASATVNTPTTTLAKAPPRIEMTMKSRIDMLSTPKATASVLARTASSSEMERVSTVAA